MSDANLKILVETELEWEPSVDSVGIGVAVSKGVVTLSGSVKSYAEKSAAERAAHRVKGVRGVALDLDVRPYGDYGTNDDEIAKRALNTLDWQTSIPKEAVKVKVDDGQVTLTGEVDWQYQRESAQKAVQRLYGVRSVSNQISLHKRVAATDVKQRIEDALDRQAQLDANNVRVVVEGSRVRLEGKVNAWADRDIIERAAWSAPGVTTVEDRVTVSA